jgi:hypothetical protein
MGNEEPQLPLPPEEGEVGKELTIDDLPAHLNLAETPAMKVAADKFTEALAGRYTDIERKRLANLYLSFGEKIMDSLPPEVDITKSQVALAIAKALLRRDAVALTEDSALKEKLLSEYLEDLEEIWDMTTHPDLEEIVPSLRAELRSATAELDALKTQ